MHPSAPQLLYVPSRLVVPPTTWNANDISSQLTLSGGNLTATNSGGASDGLVRATSSKSSGKWYFEITDNNNSSGLIGIATASASLSAPLGDDVAGWGLKGGGLSAQLRNNASAVVSASPSYSTGDIVGVHVDLTGLLIYFRINGTNWHSMDPAAGTGGQAIASGSWFPAYSAGGVNENATLNVGTTAFNNSPASGFSAWG